MTELLQRIFWFQYQNICLFCGHPSLKKKTLLKFGFEKRRSLLKFSQPCFLELGLKILCLIAYVEDGPLILVKMTPKPATTQCPLMPGIRDSLEHNYVEIQNQSFRKLNEKLLNGIEIQERLHSLIVPICFYLTW